MSDTSSIHVELPSHSSKIKEFETSDEVVDFFAANSLTESEESNDPVYQQPSDNNKRQPDLDPVYNSPKQSTVTQNPPRRITINTNHGGIDDYQDSETDDVNSIKKCT